MHGKQQTELCFSLKYLIQTTALTKRYGSVNAVDSIDLVVPEGSIFGFLGPNGSGKTTTIRMLLGLIFPTSGEIKVLEKSIPRDLGSVLINVGAVVEGPGLYPALSAEQYLARTAKSSAYARAKAKLSGELPSEAPLTPDIDAALELVGLSKVRHRKVKAYSLGMKQRLALANALLYPRKLLILDEPTNGMDPQGILEMRELIATLSNAGTTIFVSSHLLSEIEATCTHVAVIQHGRLLFQGEVSELRNQLPSMLTIGVTDPQLALEILGSQFSLTAEIGSNGLLTVNRGIVRIEDISAALVGAGLGVYRIAEDSATVEEAFVAITGKGSDVS